MSAQEAIATFLVEAQDLLEQVERGLLDLNENLGDKALVDDVFRGLHTLKGSGAMFGFDALAGFTHHCETAFDRVRKGEVAATPELVAAVLDAKDHMRALLEGGENLEGRSAELLAALGAAVSGPAASSEAPRPTTWSIRFALPLNAMANGTNPLALLDELRDLGDCVVAADLQDVPALDELIPTECRVGWNVTLTTDQPKSAIEDVFIFVMDDMRLEMTPADGEPAQEPAPVGAPEAAPAETPAEGAAVTAGRGAKGGETVRVPAERLDELMDRVGELVIAQSRLSQLANTSHDLHLRAVSEEVERLASELRDTMMVLRMVPVSSLFGRFRRLVHDLARETGKSIELITAGEATEVDKTVIERLADPLVHLIRNSVDHGLETPEDREAGGKPATGQVKLSARQAGGEVVISVSDDGRGINRERVKARAEAQGLLAEGAQPSDADLLQLIFHPGFSTAQQITNLSGRGVGMDVVKRTVESLRGSIEVLSPPGGGSEISLRIPLTLAIIDGLLVRVGGGKYVIPLSAVEECLELSLEDDLRSRGRSFITLRGDLVPFVRLRELFRTDTRPDPHQKIVVVSTGASRVGLAVDQIIGDHQTVVKPLSKVHEQVSTFSGATILGDGGVALILDIPSLVAAGQRQDVELRAAG